MQQTNKWQAHLPFLHLEKKFEGCIIQSLKTIKIETKNQHTDAIFDNRTSQFCACVESCVKSLKSLPVGPRSHKCDNKQKIGFVTQICP